MKKKKFAQFHALLGAFLGALVGYSVATGNAALIVIAVAVGLVVEHLYRKRTKEVLEDERILKIAGRASYKTFRVGGIALAVAGALLLALSKAGYPQFEQMGLALAFSVCVLLVLYVSFYSFYSKKP